MREISDSDRTSFLQAHDQPKRHADVHKYCGAPPTNIARSWQEALILERRRDRDSKSEISWNDCSVKKKALGQSTFDEKLTERRERGVPSSLFISIDKYCNFGCVYIHVMRQNLLGE
jgi:hypothetical protein